MFWGECCLARGHQLDLWSACNCEWVIVSQFWRRDFEWSLIMGWCRRTRLHSPQFIASIAADLHGLWFYAWICRWVLSFYYFCLFLLLFCIFLQWFWHAFVMGFVIIREIKVVGHEQIGAMIRILTTFFLFLTARVWADIVMMKLSSLLSHIFFASSKFYQKGCVFCQS